MVQAGGTEACISTTGRKKRNLCNGFKDNNRLDRQQIPQSVKRNGMDELLAYQMRDVMFSVNDHRLR